MFVSPDCMQLRQCLGPQPSVLQNELLQMQLGRFAGAHLGPTKRSRHTRLNSNTEYWQFVENLLGRQINLNGNSEHDLGTSRVGCYPNKLAVLCSGGTIYLALPWHRRETCLFIQKWDTPDFLRMLVSIRMPDLATIEDGDGDEAQLKARDFPFTQNDLILYYTPSQLIHHRYSR